jgi:hypothetical protein
MMDKTITVALIALFGVAVFLVVSAGALGFFWLRRRYQQTRLDQAFQRARRVRQSGSGVQGTPYSVYGDSAAPNDPWHRR